MPDNERVISPEETHNPEGALPGDGNESTRSPPRNLGQRIYEAIHIKDEPGTLLVLSWKGADGEGRRWRGV